MSSDFLSLFVFDDSEIEASSVLLKQGPFEVRDVPRMNCAKVTLKEMSPQEGKNILTEYLHGNNFRVQLISSLGHPFIVRKASEIELGILLPLEMSYSDIPKPVNRLIKIEELPPTKMGSLIFKGEPSDERIERREYELKKWLNVKGQRYFGPVRLTSDEFMIPSLRTNEILIEIL